MNQTPNPEPEGIAAVMNYDPNLTTCGCMAVQTVRLTLARWHYRTERTVTVGGNCTGMAVLKAAVWRLYDELPLGSDGMGSMLPEIILRDAEGNELSCTDDEGKDEDWLGEMVIGAEIIAIVPEDAK